MRELANLQAERDILSIVAKKPEIIFKYDVSLKPNAFSDSIHREMFRFILDQYKEGSSIVVPSLFSHEAWKQKIFSEISESNAPSESYVKLARVLNELKSLRELRDVGTNIVYSVNDGQDSGTALLEKYGSQLSTIQLHNDVDEIGDIRSDLDSFHKLIEEARDSVQSGKGRPIHGPLTYTSLDNFIIGGLEPNDLMIVAAKPSVGKTEFVLQMMVANMKLGIPAAIFSLEMSKQQIFYRMLAHITGVSGVNLKTGEGLDSNAMKRIAAGIEEMKKWKLYVDDSQSVNMSEILAKSKKLKFIEKSLGMIVVDYATLVSNDLVDGPTHEKVGGIARSLKVLSGQINTPTILVSQLRRTGDDDDRDPEPNLDDLKSSGDLEANADIVLFLHSALMDRRKSRCDVKVYIAKNRNNPLGGIMADNNKNTQTIKERQVITE